MSAQKELWMNLSIEAYHDVESWVDLDMFGITALADDRDEIVEINVWVIFLEQSVAVAN